MPSTVIASFKYDPEKQVLRVRFVSGLTYDYLKVPPDVYAEMKSSLSKGTYLNQYIKGYYDYKKIN